jgi:putative salt-induced outer membrane protein
MKLLIAFAAVTAAQAVQAEPIPADIAAMIDAAAGDPAQLKTVADIAKKARPGAAAEIDARVAAITAKAEAEKAEKLASQGVFEGWTGQGEIGATNSTGNTKSTGVAIAIGLNKETTHWRHGLKAAVDYQRDNGVTSKDRYFAGYEGNYKFSDRFYAVGTLSWEKDRFAGYDRRFSESLGLGYTVIDSKDFKLSLEGGPALRQTEYITGLSESTFAGRAAANMLWQISDGVALTENFVSFFDSNDTTLQSTTALTAKLIGALSARASFYISNESNPPLGLEKTNTTSRLTLVYSF